MHSDKAGVQALSPLCLLTGTLGENQKWVRARRYEVHRTCDARFTHHLYCLSVPPVSNTSTKEVSAPATD